MSNTTFLYQLAQEIIQNHSENISEVTIILPNKRAKVFLLEEIKKCISKNIFAPEIISIEEFVQNMAQVRSVDNVELLFEFYEVYLSVTEQEAQEPFENFANWASILLQDFNEIDRYLLEPDKILKYLENIKEIEHWSVDSNKKTELIEKYLLFWKKLPLYYHSLYQYLLNKGIGYQGLIYREAVENLDHFSESNQGKQYVFAGFNALNQAEEKIIQHLLALDKAKIYWDIDDSFFKDDFHDAGLFQRRFKKEWSYYKTNPYQWIQTDFSQSKNITVISTPKAIGQAKIVGDLVAQHNQSGNMQKTAVVLGEENLLLPILYSLPNSVDSLNITMGYSSKNNPAQLLIAKLFKMHTNALTRNPNQYVMYYKDVLEVLTHPLVESYINADGLVERIKKNNYSFITHQKLQDLYAQNNELFILLFQKWDNGCLAVLESISKILLGIKENLDTAKEDEKISNAFLYSIYKVINKMISYFSKHHHIDDIKTLQAIYKQVIELAEVSFEGEPLEGLHGKG